MTTGFAGRISGAFMDSKLTPLLLLASLVIGAVTLFTMASEEEPQIIVPLADIYLPVPGAEPEEIENRVLVPLENVLSGIEGVEYVYSHAESGFALVTVRFEVGLNVEESLTKLFSTLYKYADRMPSGLSFPLVKSVAIDDVPFFTATFFGSPEGGVTLRSIVDEIRVELEGVPEVRDVSVVGGYPREIRVEIDPEKLSAMGFDATDVAERLRADNIELGVGDFVRGGEVVRVRAGGFLSSGRDVESVILGVRDGRLVQVRDVATVVDGPAEVTQYTFHLAEGGAEWAPMVAVSVSKRPGADATVLGRRLEERLERVSARVLPSEVTYRVTRNYGETAREKVTTLKEHLGMAVLAVGLVILFTMGWRSALVVMMAVPVTFALTLFVYQILGYTLNRVTLFALIFVTGIVIDDSIIVAENMERHFAMRKRSLREAARIAVDEVGNPTILATLTVIAAVLPMLFVSGLMGPYMSPMPIGATLAMLFSLGVALIITPWLTFRLLKGAHEGEAQDEADFVLEETRLYGLYRMVMGPLMDRPARIWAVLGAVSLMLVAAVSLFLTRAVPVKMLPFDDKSELQLIVDLPEGTPLEATVALASDLGSAVARVPEVSDVQLYAGVAAPFTFNGLIRHYYLRRAPNMADLQVNLVDKGERDAQSHDVALALRPIVQRIAAAFGDGASIKVVEVPPGPPVMSTLVAEIYGPDDEARLELAEVVRAQFEAHPSIVDVDWSLADDQREVTFRVDDARAALTGVPKGAAAQALRIALAGDPVTTASAPSARTEVSVRVGLSEAKRSGTDRLADLHVRSLRGAMVPLSAVTSMEEGLRPQPIDRKNGHRVVYVMSEVAGDTESPVYAILDLMGELTMPGSGGEEPVPQLFTGHPVSIDQPVLKWDGEWQITYEVFRDLGLAFAGALVLIYVLIVAWFGSFVTPAVMMSAIPLTLVGIGPGHFAFGAFFTATSMIGMIALAGIMVRNGILLIDYLEARIGDGVPLRDAVLEAGAVRTRPIALTAGTVVIGAIVILFDPIFQGLAVSLITGAIASTVLTLIVVPGIYFLVRGGGRTSE
jgi:multidrug efflux pump subunit AcrB